MKAFKRKDIPDIDFVVHKQRVAQELIFQRLIASPELSAVPVGALREIARQAWILVSNFLCDLECPDDKIVLVSDKYANDPRFIPDLIVNSLFVEDTDNG